jgi:dTDP-4-dehydrorhamnose reductase
MPPPRAIAPLVLGAGGMLGRAVTHLLERQFPDTVGATRTEIDVTDRFRLEAEVERLRPTVVINCAAYTDVDGCEADPDRARRVNAEGAEYAARAAASAGCRIMHISTDFVFDGRSHRPYIETDHPAPLSEYGRSKLEGEARVMACASEHLIVRTSWLYGAGRGNFVDTIRHRAAAGEMLKVVNDQHGSPCYAEDLARALRRLIEIDQRGVVHYANGGGCSRFELAAAVLDEIGTDAARLEAISTDTAGRLAVRPARSVLDTSLYTRLTGETPRPWKDALRAYLRGEGAAGAV